MLTLIPLLSPHFSRTLLSSWPEHCFQGPAFYLWCSCWQGTYPHSPWIRCQAWLPLWSLSDSARMRNKTARKGSEVVPLLKLQLPLFPHQRIKERDGLLPQQGWGGPALPGRRWFLNWFIYFPGPFLIFLINSLVGGSGKFISSCYHSNQLSCTGYHRKCTWGLLKELGL